MAAALLVLGLLGRVAVAPVLVAVLVVPGLAVFVLPVSGAGAGAGPRALTGRLAVAPAFFTILGKEERI